MNATFGAADPVTGSVMIIHGRMTHDVSAAAGGDPLTRDVDAAGFLSVTRCEFASFCFSPEGRRRRNKKAYIHNFRAHDRSHSPQSGRWV